MPLRLTSRYLYVYKDKFRGIVWGATNLRALSRKSGIPYGRLRWWFSDQDKDTVEFDDYRIDRLSTSMIFTKVTTR